MPPRARLPLASLAAALFTLLALYAVLRIAGADFTAPLNYLEDANVFLTRAKSITEGNWVWHNPRLGMPFGANWFDFPINVTLDSSLMWLVSCFTSSPPLVLNIEWMLGIAATAALGVVAFVRLGFTISLAACSAVLFALLPYTWFQGEKHLHCISCAVPLVAAAAIEVVRGVRRVPVYAWVGCVLAGLSYAYLAFFACFVLSSAAVIAWIGRRGLRSASLGLLLTGVVVITALADLAPTLAYEARNGANAQMLFKSPAETEIYNLKIRYLLTPVPDHPIGLLRRIEHRLADVKYPFIVNENEYARLGTVGSIGFLAVLAYIFLAICGRRPVFDGLLGPCSALMLGSILFAVVGGFSVFWVGLVSPDVRVWSRIFPFLGFFAIAAFGAIASRYLGRRAAVLAIIAVLGVFDQAVPAAAYDHNTAVYRSDDEFVRGIDTILPPGSAVFELPYTDFPNDKPPGKMLVNDLLRPYLHSANYRWSWGAVSGNTSAEWAHAVAALPVPEMLSTLVEERFTGLWVDTAGYQEAPITAVVGSQPYRSRDGRFAFYDLRPFAASPHKPEAPVLPLFERGFYFEESGGGHFWHWSLPHGRITLVNPSTAIRRVAVSMRIEAADKLPHQVRVGAGAVRTPVTFSRTLDLPASGKYSFDLVCDCPAVNAGSRVIYFLVWDLTVRSPP